MLRHVLFDSIFSLISQLELTQIVRVIRSHLPSMCCGPTHEALLQDRVVTNSTCVLYIIEICLDLKRKIFSFKNKKAFTCYVYITFIGASLRSNIFLFEIIEGEC